MEICLFATPNNVPPSGLDAISRYVQYRALFKRLPCKPQRAHATICFILSFCCLAPSTRQPTSPPQRPARASGQIFVAAIRMRSSVRPSLSLKRSKRKKIRTNFPGISCPAYELPEERLPHRRRTARALAERIATDNRSRKRHDSLRAVGRDAPAGRHTSQL